MHIRDISNVWRCYGHENVTSVFFSRNSKIKNEWRRNWIYVSSINFILSKTKKKLTNRTKENKYMKTKEFSFAYKLRKEEKKNESQCYDWTSITDVGGASTAVFFSLSLLRWCFLLFDECRCFLWCFLCFFPFFTDSSWVFSFDSSTTASTLDESVVGSVGVSFLARSSFVARERLLDRRRSRL